MKDFSLTDLYMIGRTAVQLYPENPERPCLQPKAFRVLQTGHSNEISSSNLGAVPTDKDSPFFWSKKWMQEKYNPNKLGFEWPILTMYHIGDNGGNVFQPGMSTYVYNIQLAVLDLYRKDCVNGSIRGCNARQVNQIYIDTATILKSILQYFKGIVIANTDRQPKDRIYYLPALIAQRQAGNIRMINVVRELQEVLSNENRQINFEPVDESSGIHGTTCRIMFPTRNCDIAQFKCEATDYGTVGFESGNFNY